jgi:hypothetical protein
VLIGTGAVLLDARGGEELAAHVLALGISPDFVNGDSHMWPTLPFAVY